MRRPPRESSWIRRFSGLLTLVVLPRAVAEKYGGDIPIQPTCNPPAQLENGFMEPLKLIYEKGDFVKYYCKTGFKLIGPVVHECIADGEVARWNASLPQCKMTRNFTEKKEAQLKSTDLVTCENPVVKHGVLLSGFKHTYTFGSIVTFECLIGYFMVGSYFIQCVENSLWNPEVPSCRKIDPDICGAPLIPNGIVQPLQHQYIVNTEVLVQCNPQQCFPDETIEMSTVCQGFNLWEPPVLTCFTRTSPDTYKLQIHNGRIIERKKMYFPGDNATIQCNAGYVLQGSPTIRYIGGKKWVPSIPTCSLSFFFILLIIAMIFITLPLPIKMICDKYLSQ